MNTTIADDPRAKVETVITSLTGIIITVISASTSAIASALVIYIILRSTKGLRKSVYHRIMFGMNVADILQSTAIAFTTLPMPKDMIYDFKGIVIGNHTSCQVQGFFVTFGCFSGFLYNATLSVYYLCSINYNMMDQKFSKCLEPCLHVVAVSLGLAVAIIVSLADNYHPSPTSKTWCGHSQYPYWCDVLEDYSCHGKIVSDKLAILKNVATPIIIGVAGLCVAVTIGTMILVVLKVRRQRRIRILEQLENYRSATSAQSAADNLLKRTKIVTKQAIAYAMVNFLSILCVILLPAIMQSSFDISKPPPFLQIIYLALRPLQGLFNAIIFIMIKVHGFRRSDPTQNILLALKRLLNGEEAPDRIISDMLIIVQDDAIMNLRRASDVDIGIEIDRDGDCDGDNDYKESGLRIIGKKMSDCQKPCSIGAEYRANVSESSQEDTSEYCENIEMKDENKNTTDANIDDDGDGRKMHSTNKVATNNEQSQDEQCSFGDIISQDLSGYSHMPMSD